MLDNAKNYRLPNELLTRPVRVLLVGAGGNGSQILPGLARLHMTMLALGHPGGLHVVTMDGDTVSESNVGRQLFYKTDIGQYKSVVLTHRVNACYGLKWEAAITYFKADSLEQFRARIDIVIGCVDTRKARRAVHSALMDLSDQQPYRSMQPLWLDLGNDAFTGQCILGQAPSKSKTANAWKRLPFITEFYPDILDASGDEVAEREAGPSCSLAAAIEKQSAFVNQMCATHALNLLGNLFRFGVVEHSALFFDAKSGRSSPFAIDPAAWARFGIERPALDVPGDSAKPDAESEDDDIPW